MPAAAVPIMVAPGAIDKGSFNYYRLSFLRLMNVRLHILGCTICHYLFLFVVVTFSFFDETCQDGIRPEVIICNVSPAKINAEETLSSLRFAERAKKIENKVGQMRPFVLATSTPQRWGSSP